MRWRFLSGWRSIDLGISTIPTNHDKAKGEAVFKYPVKFKVGLRPGAGWPCLIKPSATR